LLKVDFVPAACCAPVELLHGLKLYHAADAAAAAAAAGVPAAAGPVVPSALDMAGAGPQLPSAARKPVIRDKYDEFVFVAPPEAFRDALAAHVRREVPPTEVSSVTPPHNDAQELWAIAAARRAVAQHTAAMREQLGVLA
jgi:hypothetical protein